MILKLKSEFPSTSIWYDTYSAQESLETKAMVLKIDNYIQWDYIRLSYNIGLISILVKDFL